MPGMIANEVFLGTATAYLALKDQGFFDGVNQAQSAMQSLGDSTGSSMSSMEKLSLATGSIGMSLTRNITTPAINAGKSILDAYRSTESAFVGVQKTLDQNKLAKSFGIVLKEGEDIDKQLIPAYDRLNEAIWDMTQETASSYEEIAGVMEMAGQLNVALGKNGQGLIDFTKNIIMLNDTTDLMGADAAKTLAQMTNILGTSEEDFGRLGATIVDLGNNSATTEADIVSMAKRIAGAGELVSLTDQDILAIAATLQSVGISAEMGGSAFSKVLKKMQTAAESGYEPIIDLTEKTGYTLRELALMSENDAQAFTALANKLGMKKSELKNMIKWGELLENFAKIAGMTAEQFVNAWRSEPVKAVEAFTKGLGDVDTQGKSTVQMLQDMGFTEVRLSDTLARLALAQDGFTENLERANAAWGEASALEEEAARRYGTLDSQISQLNESWKELRVELAEFVVPILQTLMDIAREIIGVIKEMPDWLKQTIVNLTALLAVVGPGFLIFSRILEVIINLKRAIEMLSGLRLVSKIGDIAKGILGVKNNCHLLGTCMGETASKMSGLGGAFKSALGWIGTAITNIVPILVAIIGHFINMKDLFGKLVEAVKAGDLGGIFKNILAILWSILNPIQSAILGFGKLIIKALGLEETVDKVVGSVKKFFGGMVDSMQKQWNGFLDALHKKHEETKAKFKRLWEEIKDAFGQAVDWMKEKYDAFVAWWRNFGDNIKEIWKNIWESVGSFVLDIIGKIRKTISDWFYDTFGANGFLSGIPAYVNSLVGEVFDIVSSTVMLIVNVIKDLFNILVDIFTLNFDKLKSDLKALWDHITGWLSYVVERITFIIYDIASIIQLFFSDMGKKISDAFNRAKEKVVNFFSDLREKISSHFSELRESIHNCINGIREVVENITSKIKNIFNDFKEHIKNNVQEVKDAVSNIIEFLSDFVEKAIQKIKDIKDSVVNFVKNVGETIGNFFSDLFNGLMERIHQRIEELQTAFENFPERFKELASRMLRGFLNGLEEAWDSIRGFFEEHFGWVFDMIDRVKNALSDVGHWVSDHIPGFATGLDYVPYDNFVARLHQGERVLTKQEAEEYNRGSSGSGGDIFNFYNTQPDPYEYARQMKRAKKELLYT